MPEAGVDGGTLRHWRESRHWDVLRMARELIKAADEPVASLDGLTHMINAWERDARPPSPRYLLLYMKIFQSHPNGAAPRPGQVAASALHDADAFPRRWEIDAMEAAALRRAGGAREAEIKEMASALRIIQEQVDVIARRLAELAGDDPGSAR